MYNLIQQFLLFHLKKDEIILCRMNMKNYFKQINTKLTFVI